MLEKFDIECNKMGITKIPIKWLLHCTIIIYNKLWMQAVTVYMDLKKNINIVWQVLVFLTKDVKKFMLQVACCNALYVLIFMFVATSCTCTRKSSG